MKKISEPKNKMKKILEKNKKQKLVEITFNNYGKI